MKWILVLYCLMFSNTIIFAQAKIEKIRPLVIKLKMVGEKKSRVYLMDIDESSLTYFTDKKQLKANLLNACKSCEKVALEDIEKLILPSAKKHSGKIIGGILALMITGVAALNPRGDGLGPKETAAIYGSYYGSITFGLGALLDGVTNNSRMQVFNERKRKIVGKNRINFDAFPNLATHTAIAQFESIQEQQRQDLQVILLEIQEDVSKHLDRFSFFSKEESVKSGYVIGNDEKYLFLSDDLLSVVENRADLPSTYKKIALTEIFYYQIN